MIIHSFVHSFIPSSSMKSNYSYSKKSEKQFNIGMVLSVFWTLWLVRNARFFEEKEMDVIDLYEKAKFTASLWASIDKNF